jgi:enoyl reductase
MPAVIRRTRAAAILAAALAGAALMTPPAHATETGGRGGNGTQSTPTGGSDPSSGLISASVTYDTSKNGRGPSTGPLTAVGGSFTPPPCWYAPAYTPEQFKALEEGVWGEDSTGYEWDNTQRDRYVNGKPYKNFNMDKAGKGYWWTGFPNEADIADPASTSCDAPYFWVDTGDTPPVQNAITPEMLAKLAYQAIRIPNERAELNPTAVQTVNLPTWIWMNQRDIRPVSVTASVPLLGISATTTATPVSMTIDPGTKDAQTFPASGTCTADGNHHLGTPYNGSHGNPPCGVTYLRSTDGTGPFRLKATITWAVSWVGTGHADPTTLPSGTYGRGQDVTVQEIQSVNR